MPRLRRLALALALLAVPALGAAASTRLRLNVPSPDWRDQVIYFVVTDRFDDANPANDDQGAGEYRPGDGRFYQGGDLAGVARRLAYVRGLGATTVWITPPVANQWLAPGGGSAGYHGYWAENFAQVDKHLGTLADYRHLSDRLHRAGMYLVQDIVVNHTGDYFWYDAAHWNPADPAQGYHANADTPPVAAPSQWPFSLNDPRRAADRAAAIYHWTPNVADYANRDQVLNWQMSGLDDLDTENPLVRRALRKTYGDWIREAGVDGFRVDTAFYVPEDFFADFLHADDPQAPGIDRVARQTGRRDFLSFGEGFGIDRPGEDTMTRRIEAYAEPGRLRGMLNFPLYGALGDVFARGQPTADLGDRITTMMRLNHDPYAMPSFVDNHDVDRFLAGGSDAGLRQALLAMMTLPGIPVIYYGTEQGFREPRASMFAAGAGSGGRDHFDTHALLYRFIRRATALRAGHGHLFSRGRPQVLQADGHGPGGLAWRTDLGTRSALVVFNTAGHELLFSHLATGLPAGTRLQAAFGLDGKPGDQVVGPGGELTLVLPPRAGWVWMADRHRAVAAPSRAPAGSPLDIAALPSAPVQGLLPVHGRAVPDEPFQLVLDGDLRRAQVIAPQADGRWQAEVDTRDLLDPAQAHRLEAWRARDGALSAPRAFHAEPAWTPVADLDDPAGDDRGPLGRYLYPADTGDAPQRTMDLRHLHVSTAGGNLRIELTMAAISQTWNPPNGFDHLALTLFIALPGAAGGARVMPLQDAMLPPGLRWQRRLRVNGWTSALFSDEGASASSEGQPVAPTAEVHTDAARRTITLTLPAAALGQPASLHGARLYLNTWDYDGGYRPLAMTAGPWTLGGGDPHDPKVMDDTPVITLP